MVPAPLDVTSQNDAIALWEACGLTRPWNDPAADFARAIAGPGSAILGVSRDGSLLGTVMVGDDGHRGWVYYLAVAAAVRREGLGSALMHAAEDWLRRRGAPRLNLMVRTENAAILGFYLARGYMRSEVTVLQKTL